MLLLVLSGTASAGEILYNGIELQNASNDAFYEIALWTKIQIDSD